MEAATLHHAPERSLEQRMSALQEANRIRVLRADLKRRLRADRHPWAAARARQLILEPGPDFATMYVFDLLLAVPKLGRTKVNRALTRCRISPSKTLGGLSERQRSELAKVLYGA